MVLAMRLVEVNNENNGIQHLEVFVITTRETLDRT